MTFADDLVITPSWPDDNLLSLFTTPSNEDINNLFPSCSPEYSCSDTSESESDSSPSYSRFTSSPIYSDNNQCTTNYFNTSNSQNEDSLDFVLRKIIESDPSYSFYKMDYAAPCLKKRKLSELDTITTPPCEISRIIDRVKKGEKVFLDRNQLLDFSSSEFDLYSKTLSSVCCISSEEKEILKKQRRVIKNREYAQKSRKKKQEKFDELQSRIDDLEKENTKLKSENYNLKENIKSIIGAYQKSKQKQQFELSANIPIPTTQSYDTILPAPSNPKTTSSTFNNLFSINTPTFESSSKATGACLFILLLSFGFLFSLTGPSNGFNNNNNNNFSSRTGRIILESEDVDPSWWDNLVSHISYTINAAENARKHSIDSNMSIVTTVTTNIGTTSSNESLYDYNNWDDSHVCDYSLKFNNNSYNQTSICQC